MKKLNLILMLLGMAFFAGCSGDAVENIGVNDEAIKAKLTIIVRDVVTGAPIEGAEVSLLSANKSTFTKAEGLASFDDVRVGTYRLKIELDDYVSVQEPVTISREGIAANETEGDFMYVAGEYSKTVWLNPKKTNLYGYIFYVNNKGQTLPAEGSKVYVELLGGSFIEKLFDATVDENGKFSFEAKLPVAVPCRVWATPPESGLEDIAFETLEIYSSITLLEGSRDVGKQTFSQTKNNENFEVSYNRTVAKDGNIVFDFTAAINPSSLKVGTNATVQVKVNDVLVAVTTKWEDDNKKLTITPAAEWENDVNVIFTGLKSLSGKEYKNDIIIILETPVLDKAVDGLKAFSGGSSESFNYNATSVNLRWNLVEGATSYIIHRQDNKDTLYVPIGEVTITKGAEIGSRDFVSLGGALEGRTVSFMVQASNKNSKSPLDLTKTIKVVDNMSPISLVTDDSKCLKFNEPIDQKTLSVSGTSIVYKNDNYACVASTSGTYTITGIQDQAGNKYNTDGTGTITF